MNVKVCFMLSLLAVGIVGTTAPRAEAAPRWQNGFAFWGPQSRLSSDEAATSLQSLRETGADQVMLVVSWFVGNAYDPDIRPGPTTPTDPEIVVFVQRAHALGLAVVIGVRVESLDGTWRAYFAPYDKSAWFANYRTMLEHYVDLADRMGVAGLVIGGEFVSLSGPAYTAYWADLIAMARAGFGGFLTYSANWGGSAIGNQGLDQLEEFSQIEFWPLLDFVGISCYVELAQTPDPSFTTLMANWGRWYNNRVAPVLRRVGKPLLLTEVGYRSEASAPMHPWDYLGNAGVQTALQAELYLALFQFWRGVPEFRGLYIWHWDADPQAGGPKDSGYTPQGKIAEEIVVLYFRDPEMV